MRQATLRTVLERVHDRFNQAELVYGHGTDNAWDEAVALVLTVTGYADDEQALDLQVSSTDQSRIDDLAGQRIQSRQPLAYLLGQCTYLGLTFELQPGVIVPRSPIGHLLADGVSPWLPARVERIVDLCSGTGCLGIVAAHMFEGAQVTLVEMDETALEVAQRNVHSHGLSDRVRVVAGDVTDPLDLGEPFDLVVSNPPYVDAADMGMLPAEYRAEPELGLAAGADGLSVLHGIIAQLPNWLADDGLFVGEVGASAPALIRHYAELPFIWPDLPNGGEGVFLLEAASLSFHTARGI